MKNTVENINTAEANAVKVIANAAREAAKVVSDSAREAVKLVNVKDGNDHDLLIKLETKMDDLKEDIKDLKDGTTAQIENHGNRIEVVEKWRSSLEGENGLLSNIPKNGARLTVLELAKTAQQVTMGIGIGILSLLVGLLTYHLFQ